MKDIGLIGSFIIAVIIAIPFSASIHYLVNSLVHDDKPKKRYFLVFWSNGLKFGYERIVSNDGSFINKTILLKTIAEREGIDIIITAPIQELTEQDYLDWVK